jgi:hypothetical protein
MTTDQKPYLGLEERKIFKLIERIEKLKTQAAAPKFPAATTRHR